uniref:TIL domain-containing protein n=1 Tax=Steinernema glaseri TaxID=37863 RepID=A0A1I7YTT8_9BILA
MKFLALVFALLAVAFVAARPPTEAPQPCGQNEYWAQCSTCELTCKDAFADFMKPCVLMCFPPKCQCKQDFYRNDNGQCVAKKDCYIPDQVIDKKEG